jgi:hypothetical protein
MTGLGNVTKNFTPDIQPSGFFVGHDTLVGGKDGDTKAVDNPWHVLNPFVKAKTWTANAGELLDNGLAGTGNVFEGDFDMTLGSFVLKLVISDVAFLKKNLCDGFFGVGGRDFNNTMTGLQRIAQAG